MACLLQGTFCCGRGVVGGQGPKLLTVIEGHNHREVPPRAREQLTVAVDTAARRAPEWVVRVEDLPVEPGVIT